MLHQEDLEEVVLVVALLGLAILQHNLHHKVTMEVLAAHLAQTLQAVVEVVLVLLERQELLLLVATAALVQPQVSLALALLEAAVAVEEHTMVVLPVLEVLVLVMAVLVEQLQTELLDQQTQEAVVEVVVTQHHQH
jgi:hypothetical protein